MKENPLKTDIAYDVKIKTTTALGDTFVKRGPKGTLESFPSLHQHITVLTTDPKKIYKVFGDNLIVSITRIGPGYLL